MKFVVKEYPVKIKAYKKEVEEISIGIGLKDENTNFVYPSSLTNYIKNEYRRKSKSLNTQRVAASTACSFLNYCYEQIENGNENFESLKEDGLFGLKMEHAADYISFVSIKNKKKELTKNSVNQKIQYLNSFYRYLHKDGIITIPQENLQKKDMFDDSKLGTVYPNRANVKKQKLVDFGKYRYEITREFLQIAKKEYPHCYLGFCLQFFGGLRKAEVVNLKTDSLVINDEYAYVTVEDNAVEFFGEKKTNYLNQVKKPRIQGLIVNPILLDAYKTHKEFLKTIKNEKSSLFVSTRTKKPLTSSSLGDAFNSTKEKLIQKIIDEGRTNEYVLLTERPWSTHVGRGVFTNFCFDKGMNVTEVAIARGDANLSSVLSYIDEINVREQLTEGLDKIMEYDKTKPYVFQGGIEF